MKKILFLFIAIALVGCAAIGPLPVNTTRYGELTASAKSEKIVNLEVVVSVMDTEADSKLTKEEIVYRLKERIAEKKLPDESEKEMLMIFRNKFKEVLEKNGIKVVDTTAPVVVKTEVFYRSGLNALDSEWQAYMLDVTLDVYEGHSRITSFQQGVMTIGVRRNPMYPFRILMNRLAEVMPIEVVAEFLPRQAH